MSERRSRFNNVERAQILKNNGPWCGICGKKVIISEGWDCDHIIPFEQGGETAVYNGQVTHISCNRSKRNQFQKRTSGPNWTRRWGQELSYESF